MRAAWQSAESCCDAASARRSSDSAVATLQRPLRCSPGSTESRVCDDRTLSRARASSDDIPRPRDSLNDKRKSLNSSVAFQSSKNHVNYFRSFLSDCWLACFGSALFCFEPVSGTSPVVTLLPTELNLSESAAGLTFKSVPEYARPTS
jgi:hypothetical protein